MRRFARLIRLFLSQRLIRCFWLFCPGGPRWWWEEGGGGLGTIYLELCRCPCTCLGDYEVSGRGTLSFSRSSMCRGLAFEEGPFPGAVLREKEWGVSGF